MELQKVKIESEDEHSAKIFIDGYELHYATAIDLHMDAISAPQVTISLLAMPDAEFSAAVQLDYEYSPKTLQEAARVVVEAIKDNQGFRDCVIACIVGALRDYNLPFAPEEEVAEHILNRMIGEE